MRTHPELGVGLRYAAYDAHDHARDVFEQPLSPAPDRAQEVRFGPGDLSTLRANVRFIGEGARLSEDVVDDLVLAVHELACNSIEHGGGSGVMRGWSEMAGFNAEDRGHVFVVPPLPLGEVENTATSRSTASSPA